MPANTFFKLPYYKRARIIKAAFKEFNENTLEEASINNIINNSDIARGSFYYYFNDKEDLYFYLLERHSFNIQNKIEKLLIKYDGDLYDTYDNLFDFFIYLINNKNSYIKNIFKSMNSKILYNLFIKDYENNERLESLIKNRVKYNKSYIFKTLNTILSSYIIKTFYSGKSIIEIKIEFRAVLNIIMNGALEKEN